MTTLPDDTSARLLGAAGRIFASKGYEAATIREICREAGVQNIAAVNYYFGDKEKLYQLAVRTAFKGSEGPVEPPSWPEGMAVVEKLRRFLRHFATMLIGDHRPEWHYHLMARELAQPTQGCVAFVRDLARPHFEVMAAIVREATSGDIPDERIHLTVLSILGQVIYHRCARNVISLMVGKEEAAGYSAEKLADFVAEFSLAALGLGVSPTQDRLPNLAKPKRGATRTNSESNRASGERTGGGRTRGEKA